MMRGEQPAYVAAGGIIIDDIVYPDGTTRLGVLGGGATHAAAGMMIWDQRPGILAHTGYDLPETARQRLERDFDTQGLIALDVPQARAWQIFEWDGRRTEIFRVDEPHSFTPDLEPDAVPAAYRAASGVHLLAEANLLLAWRTVFPHAVLLWEPEQPFMVAANTNEFRAALPKVDIVSPNWLEAQLVYGFGDPVGLVRAMLDDGAPVVALRMGEAGSVVGMGNTVLKLPSVPVPEIVDQTGAGNTYCGAFLVGWQHTADLETAACYGAVAASFALEVVGVAAPQAKMAEIRDQRYCWIVSQL